LCIQVAEGQHLSVPRKPKKKVINTIAEWVVLFSVCHHALSIPTSERHDMLSYLYVMAAANQGLCLLSL